HSSSCITTLYLHDALPISVVDDGFRLVYDGFAHGVCLLVDVHGGARVGMPPPGSAPSTSHGGPRARVTPSDKAGLRSKFPGVSRDRKSTRLNSSHVKISYA